jgi:hypothetical protein
MTNLQLFRSRGISVNLHGETLKNVYLRIHRFRERASTLRYVTRISPVFLLRSTSLNILVLLANLSERHYSRKVRCSFINSTSRAATNDTSVYKCKHQHNSDSSLYGASTKNGYFLASFWPQHCKDGASNTSAPSKLVSRATFVSSHCKQRSYLWIALRDRSL